MEDGYPVIFNSSPVFKQTLPNKKFIQERNQWYFVDDNGNFYVYDMGQQRVISY
jgi:hypothetical protein